MEGKPRHHDLIMAGITTMDDTNCIISHFDPEADLGLAVQTDGLNSVYSEVDLAHQNDIEDQQVSIMEDEDIIFQLMDIRVPLSRLKTALERRTGQNLSNCEFWLQNTKMLESHKTLVDQCIKGTGLVQVNIKLSPESNRIVVVDVLKPDEDLLSCGRFDVLKYEECLSPSNENVSVVENRETVQTERKQISNKIPMKWVVDEQYLNDQKRLNIPADPALWSVNHVRHWIQWAVRHFNISGVKLNDWLISGAKLCALTQSEFKEKVPNDPLDLFWTHLELLRRSKFIAVVQKEQEPNEPEKYDESTFSYTMKKKLKLMSNVSIDKDGTQSTNSTANPNRIGNNGQVQLWQFLLELLTNPEHVNVIEWIGTEGEFRLKEPEIVARLWGIRKHKPTMNYEKLSRALRYYYDGDMLAKVQGKRFVYRFICNLKELIGYDAKELAHLVAKASSEGNSKEPAFNIN